MKIILLADVHANLAALEAVIDEVRSHRPHTVIVAGDVVNRGPQPFECVELLMELVAQDGWQLIRGNHEDFVISEGKPHPGRSAWINEVYGHTAWTARKLRQWLPEIAEWPDRVELPGPDGRDLRVVHASMRNNRTGLYDKMTDQELRELTSPLPAVLGVGHTHRPFVRRVDSTLIVNAGAVGLPFDRDPRAAYAVLQWSPCGWNADINRVAYDRQRTAEAFEQNGYTSEGGPMVRLVADEFEYARPNLMRWHLDYEEAVAQGRLSVEESVELLLAARRGTAEPARLSCF